MIGIGLSLMAGAQAPKEIIAHVLQAQQNLHSAAYHVTRRDTLVSNEVRTLSGDISVDGTRFRVHQEGQDNIRIFDGKLGYDIYTNNRKYNLYEKLPGGFLYNDGTQLIVRDLLRLDTSKAVRTTLTANNDSYGLTLEYADLTAYNVTRRRKTLTISKTTWLPTAIREHQETLGRVQDLYYQISGLQLNVPLDLDLSGYSLQTLESPAVAANTPTQVTAFPFTLKSFAGRDISLEAAKGRVVLLDFWEVWCGPCIESMPKVEALYQKFHSQGLDVYGITHDSAQIAPARKLVRKFQFTFPTLIGNRDTKTKYAISSLPTYILIDRGGNIVMTTNGYSTALEGGIKELLAKLDKGQSIH